MESTKKIETDSIRRHFDLEKRKWYFSIVDIIDVTTLSTDPRNYWKVLKNRLKKASNQLVTRCNQLKMRASDGKMYLTDVADEATVLEILQVVSPDRFPHLETWFANLGNPEPEIPTSRYEEAPQNISLLQSENESYPQPARNAESIAYADGENAEEFSLNVDAYRTNSLIIIKAFIAGVSMKNISINVTRDSLTIRGSRSPIEQNAEKEKTFSVQELFWGNFSRTIELPHEINPDRVEALEEDGLLIIKLPLLKKLVTNKIVRMRTI